MKKNILFCLFYMASFKEIQTAYLSKLNNCNNFKTLFISYMKTPSQIILLKEFHDQIFFFSKLSVANIH